MATETKTAPAKGTEAEKATPPKKPSSAASLAELGIKVGVPKTDPTNKTFLIYGPSGCGKTRLAASASLVPELGRVLLVDVEAGSSSIENIYQANIDVARPADYDELKAVIEFVLNDDHEYGTVIIDTVGKMMEFMEVEQDKKKSNNKFEKWAALAEDTLRWTELLHRSGLTVILIAHTDSEKDESTGKITTSPYFLGRKTGKEAPKIFDVIAYMYVDEHPTEAGKTIRVLQTEGIDGKIAKDRTDALPILMGNPLMSKIYNRIASGVTGKPLKVEGE